MDNKTIRTYNQLADEYDEETTGFWDEFPSTVIDTFADNLPEGARVLDIGSGPGRDGLLLKERGLDVTCLDASEAMVEISRSRGLESVVGDFNNLPFEDNSFTGVWSYTSLLHVPKREIEKPFSEIDRVLKDGSIFGLGMIEGTDEKYRESSGVDKPRWFSYYTESEIEVLLDSFGFEIIYFEVFKPSSKNYLNYITQK